MKIAFSAVILSLTLPTFVAAQEAKSPLIGKWAMTVAKHNDDEITKAPLIRNELVFDAETATVTFDRPGMGGNDKMATGKYSYDGKSKPARISLKDFPSELPTTVLVKVEGDRLTICYHSKCGDVPDDFKTAKNDGREIVELARRKN